MAASSPASRRRRSTPSGCARDPQAYGAHISGRMYPRLCHPGAVLCRGAQPARAGAESVRGRGVRQGRRAGDADHPHLPADAGGDRHRPRPAGDRSEIHGGVGQHAAVQLSRLAGDQRAVRVRSERLPDRVADRRAAVRRGARAEGRRRLPARHRLPHAAARRCSTGEGLHAWHEPKVAFIGTGGTIASLGRGPLDLQDYGATGKVMHAEEIVAQWPETARSPM